MVTASATMFRSDVAADLDLQVRIRQRIADVLQARVHWALMLQQSLLSEEDDHCRLAPNSFKIAAYDALRVVETPCDVIFDHPFPTPTSMVAKPGRSLPRSKHLTGRSSAQNFLFIRSSSLGHGLEHDKVYILKCPECSRTTFTSLQGLLNHARISHQLEWGTHEECVLACATIDPNLNTAEGVEVGLGPTGILPGLRSIFQMAVGAQTIQQTTATSTSNCDTPSQQVPPNSLMKTLGLHENTPTLAPFLGKSAIRRGIRPYGQDEVVDIDSSIRQRNTRSAQAWHMPLSYRNVVRQQDDQTMQVDFLASPAEREEIVKIQADTDSSAVSLTRLGSLKSRFHFMTRIVIADRSVWILPSRRGQSYQHHTHKWMISVHSPSYAHNITTILQRLSVYPANNLDSTVFFPLGTNSPPYVVTGTSDHPFLAKIELSFNGIRTFNSELETQNVILEHWVELDSTRSITPVLGAEQIIDVELDRRTVIGPIRSGYTSIGYRSLWDIKLTDSSSTENARQEKFANDEVQDHPMLLDELVVKFPMTLRESKTSRISQSSLPYKLVSTPAQLESLTTGRRKAIEWGRAKALRDAYIELATSRSRVKLPSYTLPSIGDVYVWLSENGHFFRDRFLTTNHRMSPFTTMAEELETTKQNQRCFARGLGENAHGCIQPPSNSLIFERKLGDGSRSESCDVVENHLGTKAFLIINVRDVPSSPVSKPVSAVGSRLHPRHLLQASSPEMTLGVMYAIQELNLSSFEIRHGLWNEDKTKTEMGLAPYAMLHLTMRSFVCTLIEAGVNASRHDVSTKDGKKRRREVQIKPMPFIAASHVWAWRAHMAIACSHDVRKMALILALNAGSSSLKAPLFNRAHEDSSIQLILASSVSSIVSPPAEFKLVIDDLTVTKTTNARSATSATVVHGGDYKQSIKIDQQSYSHLQQLSGLAPLHNDAALSVVQACLAYLPHAISIAYFDSSFHHTIPPHIRSYAIDQKVAMECGLRKYGFHGLSYAFTLRAVSEHLNKNSIMIILHLGSGASACAIRKGHSLDTSMGLTPLSGLPGSTRSGNLDPSLIFHFGNKAGRTPHDSTSTAHVRLTEADDVLNRKSGWKVITGSSNFKDVVENADLTYPPNKVEHNSYNLAFHLFVDRIIKYVGAYHLKLSANVDVLVFSGGIGEQSPQLRQIIGKAVECLEYQPVDQQKNCGIGSQSGTVFDICTGKRESSGV
ncbi:hypothetical protein AX17_003248 [Amanita inopinata Kibby_2008]|nr:hypothetical protein AX17_003248 [Amanita inopinata Kibby_2008]